METKIPARLDRLPWTRFHLIVVLALGITWVLDGLEVAVRVVGMRSAEFDAINKAALNGSELAR